MGKNILKTRIIGQGRDGFSIVRQAVGAKAGLTFHIGARDQIVDQMRGCGCATAAIC